MSAECWYILSTDWLIDYRLFGCDWLYSLESVTVQLRAHVIHSYYLWHEWDMNPPLKVRPFLFVCFKHFHPVIHLLLRWALLPNAPSSNDSFTVVLTYLSGYSVNGRCTGKKTKKVQNRTTSRRKTGQIELLSTPSRPPMDLWLLSQKHLALWSSLLMAFKMVFGTALPLGKPREFTLE